MCGALQTSGTANSIHEKAQATGSTQAATPARQNAFTPCSNHAPTHACAASHDVHLPLVAHPHHCTQASGLGPGGRCQSRVCVYAQARVACNHQLLKPNQEARIACKWRKHKAHVALWTAQGRARWEGPRIDVQMQPSRMPVRTRTRTVCRHARARALGKQGVKLKRARTPRSAAVTTLVTCRHQLCIQVRFHLDM